jgi:hypothetical protein
MDILFEKLRDESSHHEVLCNSAAAISEILNTYNKFNDGKAVLEHCITAQNMNYILSSITSESSTSKIVIHNALLLHDILELFNKIKVNRS